jgi:hypothetical protein
MAFDKLIDALNEFRGEYTKALADSLQGGSTLGTGEGQGYVASGDYAETVWHLTSQPKSNYSVRYTSMQIRMADYGISLR